MIKKELINFVYGDGQNIGYKYGQVIKSFVSPIIIHLAHSFYRESNEPIGNAVNVVFFLEGTAKGVFIPHGVADKGYRDAGRLNRMELILYSGEWWKRHAIRQGIDPDKVVVVGYPKLDPIFQGIIKPRPRTSAKPRVLWAPTHNTIQEVSSWGKFNEYLPELEKHVELLDSAHPANKDMPAVTLQDLADADVVLADSGSLIYEALALDKPVILLSWLTREGVLSLWPGTLEASLYEDGPCCLANSFEELLNLLSSSLTISKEMRILADDIIAPETRGHSGMIIAKLLSKMIE